jgi:adenylate cyclase
MYSWKSVLITIGLLFTLKIWNPMFIENISCSWFDYLHSTHSVEEYNPDSGLPEIVLVDIDEKSVEVHGQLPFPRTIYANKLLEEHYSNTYVFTQVFSEPDRFGGDEEFAGALVNRLSILASAPTIQTEKGSSPFVGTSTLGGGDVKNAVWGTLGVLSPIPVLEGNTYGVGVTTATPSISGTPNFDGTIRSAPLLMQVNGDVYPSLAVEVLRAYTGEESYQLKVTDEVGVEWVRIGRQPPIATTPQGDLMISYWNKFKRYSFTDALPENVILVFGVTAEGYNNPVSTPMGVMYPHEVQANLIQTALTGVQIQQSYFLEFVETVLLLLVLLIVLVMVYRLPTALSGSLSLGLVGLQVGGSFYMWSSSLVLFDTFFSSMASLIVFGHASFNKYYITFQEKQQIKKQFQKYLSPDMIEELQKHPEKLKLGGDRKELSFLFADIVGFTPISEAYMKNDDPEGLVLLINRFLDGMSKIVLANGGTIDKFMGDCLMAWWGAPLDCPNHAEMAMKSAMEIELLTEQMNKDIKEEGIDLPPVVIGTGINTGQCIVGNMGSEERFDYSVVGDAVNLAARLEVQTRTYDTPILFSEFTKNQIDIDWKYIDEINVKGKEIPVKIYAPLFGAEKELRKLQKTS